MSVVETLRAMEVTLPRPAPPVGSYVPALRFGDQVWTSGQLPSKEGKVLFTGKVPEDMPIAKAAEASRLAMINALAAAAEAAGGVERIVRVMRVCVYVNSSPGFSEQPKVANGASDFLGEVFGEAGRHVRSAVGVAELPLNAVVEVELIVQVRGD